MKTASLSAHQAKLEQVNMRRENLNKEIDETREQFRQEQETIGVARATLSESIEAMEAGCALVASDVGGLSEILGEDRGSLVPAGDADALAAAASFSERPKSGCVSTGSGACLRRAFTSAAASCLRTSATDGSSGRRGVDRRTGEKGHFANVAIH